MTKINTHESALKQEIMAFQTTPAAATAVAASGVAKPHVTFAGAWPAAREALLLLATLVPASVRMIISMVTSVGDMMTGSVRAS